MSKNYLVNLKKDIQQIELSKSSIKNFARLHPFVSAKAGQEAFGFLVYVVAPTVHCVDAKCTKSSFQHFQDQAKFYLYESYLNFFNFIFKFNENFYNKDNFFSTHYFPIIKNSTRFIPFPILTSLTKIYALLRTKLTQLDKTIEGEDEDYSEDLQKLFTV